MTTDTEIVPGTRIVSVRGVPGGKGYHAPGIYQAQPREDGVVTWRFVANPCGEFRHQGRRMVTGYRSERKAERIAREIAEALDLEFVPGVRHGRAC